MTTNVSGLARQLERHMPRLKGVPADVEIALAASATTDGMEITVRFKDAKGNYLTGRRAFEWWISEAASGLGLTADSYSGAVGVVSTYGADNTAITAKKHFSSITNAGGVYKALAVASANPTDQYIAVKMPHSGEVKVSGASGSNWEGA